MMRHLRRRGIDLANCTALDNQPTGIEVIALHRQRQRQYVTRGSRSLRHSSSGNDIPRKLPIPRDRHRLTDLNLYIEWHQRATYGRGAHNTVSDWVQLQREKLIAGFHSTALRKQGGLPER